VNIEPERLCRILTWLVRGLYFHDHDTVLDANYRYNFRRIAPAKADERAAIILGFGMKPSWGLARGEFSYVHLWFEDPNVTFWQMIFYQRVCYEVSTIPPDIDSLASFQAHLEGLSSPSG
jgi:hypothetical protein